MTATLPHPDPPAGRTASDASRIVGEPSGESSPVIVEKEKSDEEVSDKKKTR
jgi:hypothetical protein